MLVTPLKEREKRSTWKDGGKDTPEIQLKTAFIEIDGQPMMMMNVYSTTSILFWTDFQTLKKK